MQRKGQAMSVLWPFQHSVMLEYHYGFSVGQPQSPVKEKIQGGNLIEGGMVTVFPYGSTVWLGDICTTFSATSVLCITPLTEHQQAQVTYRTHTTPLEGFIFPMMQVAWSNRTHTTSLVGLTPLGLGVGSILSWIVTRCYTRLPSYTATLCMRIRLNKPCFLFVSTWHCVRVTLKKGSRKTQIFQRCRDLITQKSLISGSQRMARME